MLKTHHFRAQAPREGDGGGRVEFLPVHWHASLHGNSTGIDRCSVAVLAVACLLFVCLFCLSVVIVCLFIYFFVVCLKKKVIVRIIINVQYYTCMHILTHTHTHMYVRNIAR